jgi:hypothetical protein
VVSLYAPLDGLSSVLRAASVAAAVRDQAPVPLRSDADASALADSALESAAASGNAPLREAADTAAVAFAVLSQHLLSHRGDAAQLHALVLLLHGLSCLQGGKEEESPRGSAGDAAGHTGVRKHNARPSADVPCSHVPGFPCLTRGTFSRLFDAWARKIAFVAAACAWSVFVLCMHCVHAARRVGMGSGQAVALQADAVCRGFRGSRYWGGPQPAWATAAGQALCGCRGCHCWHAGLLLGAPCPTSASCLPRCAFQDILSALCATLQPRRSPQSAALTTHARVPAACLAGHCGE